MKVAAAVRNAVQSAVRLSQDDRCQVDLAGHHSKGDLRNFNSYSHPAMTENQLAQEAGDKAAKPQFITQFGVLLGDFLKIVQAKRRYGSVNADQSFLADLCREPRELPQDGDIARTPHEHSGSHERGEAADSAHFLQCKCQLRPAKTEDMVRWFPEPCSSTQEMSANLHISSFQKSGWDAP